VAGAREEGLLDSELEIVTYWGGMRRVEREAALRSIESGGFDVLVTTSQFLSRNLDLLLGKEYAFIFVDDVDSLLKNSRNTDRVLMLVGFTREEIARALRDPTYSPERRAGGVLVLSTATGRPGGPVRPPPPGNRARLPSAPASSPGGASRTWPVPPP